MEWYWIAYIIGSFLFGSTIIYFDTSEEGHMTSEGWWAFFMVGVFWPVGLALGIIGAPFYGAYFLGRGTYDKKESADKAKKLIAEHEKQQWAEIEAFENEPFDERMERAQRKAIGKPTEMDYLADMRDHRIEMELRNRQRNTNSYLKGK